MKLVLIVSTIVASTLLLSCGEAKHSFANYVSKGSFSEVISKGENSHEYLLFLLSAINTKMEFHDKCFESVSAATKIYGDYFSHLGYDLFEDFEVHGHFENPVGDENITKEYEYEGKEYESKEYEKEEYESKEYEYEYQKHTEKPKDDTTEYEYEYEYENHFEYEDEYVEYDMYGAYFGYDGNYGGRRRSLVQANSGVSSPSIFSSCSCSSVLKPVCGENAVTYKNECEAKCQKVKISKHGQCYNIEPWGQGWYGNNGGNEAEVVHSLCHIEFACLNKYVKGAVAHLASTALFARTRDTFDYQMNKIVIKRLRNVYSGICGSAVPEKDMPLLPQNYHNADAVSDIKNVYGNNEGQTLTVAASIQAMKTLMNMSGFPKTKEWTGHTVEAVKNILVGLSPKEIADIPPDVFIANLGCFGNKHLHWNIFQKIALIQKLIHKTGASASWNNVIFRDARAFLPGLRISAFEELTIEKLVSLLPLFSETEDWSISQMRRIVNVLKREGAENLKYGRIKHWDGDAVASLGYLINGLSDDDVKHMSAEAIHGITSDQFGHVNSRTAASISNRISKIPPEDLKFTDKQISGMGSRVRTSYYDAKKASDDKSGAVLVVTVVGAALLIAALALYVRIKGNQKNFRGRHRQRASINGKKSKRHVVDPSEHDFDFDLGDGSEHLEDEPPLAI